MGEPPFNGPSILSRTVLYLRVLSIEPWGNPHLMHHQFFPPLRAIIGLVLRLYIGTECNADQEGTGCKEIVER